MKLMTFAAMIFMMMVSWAHEGHNKTPGALSAPHGGQIKGTDDLYIEVVSATDGFKIYPLDHDLKAVAPKDVKIEGTLRFPKKAKDEVISLQAAESYWQGKVDAKGSHRYALNLKVTYAGKTEKLSFNIEPQ